MKPPCGLWSYLTINNNNVKYKKSAQAKYREGTRRGLGLEATAVEGANFELHLIVSGGLDESDLASELAADRVGFLDLGVVAHQLEADQVGARQFRDLAEDAVLGVRTAVRGHGEDAVDHDDELGGFLQARVFFDGSGVSLCLYLGGDAVVIADDLVDLLLEASEGGRILGFRGQDQGGLTSVALEADDPELGVALDDHVCASVVAGVPVLG